MKRSLSWLLVAMFFISCGGGDDGAGPGGGGNNNTDPTPTTPGTPIGTATTQPIGAGGGTVTSADGLFSITIPPGALPAGPAGSSGAETDITIQPITNTAWGGVGTGYRLLPDGLTFSAPVELNFSLEDSLLWGSDTLFVDVARQDDDGVWGILKHRYIDWETRTLTCTTSHFSDYSAVEGLQIQPRAASLGVTSSVNLYVQYCFQQPVNDPDLVALVYSCDEDLAPLGTFTNWSANGITGGNGTVGTVAKLNAQGSRAKYTAPASVPAGNPVAVSVMAQGRRGSTMLVSNITIGGLWYGTVTIKQGNYMSEANVIWKPNGSYQGLESYRPLSGTVHYTPETDYGPSCSFVSMAPQDADIHTAFGAFFVDYRVNPPQAFGYGNTDPNEDVAVTCFTCEGWDQPECNLAQLPAWFAADSLAVSPSGDAIFWEYTDNGQLPPVYTKIDFHKGLPPVALTAKR